MSAAKGPRGFKEQNDGLPVADYNDEKVILGATPDQNGARFAAYGAYMKAMADAGVSKGGQRLHPSSTATTVRVKNGKTSVLNGPYAEVKEQLGGYSSSMRPISTPRSPGPRAARAPRTGRSKCGRSGRCRAEGDDRARRR